MRTEICGHGRMRCFGCPDRQVLREVAERVGVLVAVGVAAGDGGQRDELRSRPRELQRLHTPGHSVSTALFLKTRVGRWITKIFFKREIVTLLHTHLVNRTI